MGFFDNFRAYVLFTAALILVENVAYALGSKTKIFSFSNVCQLPSVLPSKTPPR
jgi:hypothetical protein